MPVRRSSLPFAAVIRESLVAGFFIVAAILHTWPIAANPAGLLPRNPDSLVHLWALDETVTNLLAAPARLFDGRTFHPYPDTVASVDHVFADSLLAAPLRLVTANPVFTYNVVFLATFALCGFCTYLLVRRLTGSTAAGLLSGCAFAFATARWHQLPHLHVLSAQWLPLALLMLHRTMAAPTIGTVAALAAACGLVALSSWHVALLGAVAIGTAAMFAIAARPGPMRPRLLALAMAGVLALACTLPFAGVYRRLADEWRPVSTADGRLHELSSLSLKIEGMAAAPVSSQAPYAEALARFGEGESVAFPGVVTLVLAIVPFLSRRATASRSRIGGAAWLIGIVLLLTTALATALLIAGVRGLAGPLAAASPIVVVSAALLIGALANLRRDAFVPTATALASFDSPRVVKTTYAAIATVGLVLALGPSVEAMGVSLGSGVYREDWIPVLSLIRVPARFVLLTALGVSVLAGLGLKQLTGRVPGRVRLVLAAACIVLLNLESRHAPLNVRHAPPARPVDIWLSELAESGAVLEYPINGSLWAVTGGLYHRRPTVNGIGYLQPPEFLALHGDDELSPRQLDIVWEHFHPRFIVISGDQYQPHDLERVLAAADQPTILRLRQQLGLTRVYELIDRGAGAALVRRWPRHRLEASPALQFAASVADGPPGTVSTLTVEINGRRLLHQQGASATAVTTYELTLPADAIVDGSNAVEIRGDYRYADASTAIQIGTTGTRLAADVAITSASDRSIIQVNGRYFAVDKGYALVVIDPATGTVIGHGHFNTSWYSDDSERMAAFIERIPVGAAVLVATEFDASRRLTARAVTSLGTLGLSVDLRNRFGWQHAAIAVKGAAPGSVIEAAGDGPRVVGLGRPSDRRVQLEGMALK